MDYRQTGPGGGTSIQNLEYEWDLNGNLTQRKDLRQSSLTEAFTYDALNRVDIVTLNGVQTLDVDYNLIGNITKKSDVSAGNWTYHATKKHAVTATGGGPTYSYAANGNVSAKSGSTITWYSFNLPNVINGSGVSSQFWYGPDRQRIKHVANFTSGSETTHYIGGLLEKVDAASNTHYKHYVASPSGLVATYTRRVSGTPLEDTFYFTHDHLGSIDSVTNQSAVPQVRLSFDALGKRRNEAGWSGAVPSGDWTKIATTTRRGYTEHELIDNLTLTHMNGRVYDQTIGRFASADPFVQAPFYSQSLNRYAYVWNNPLTLIDPSGFGAQITISAEQIADEASRDSSGSGGANVLSISFGAYLWVTGGRIASGAAGSSDRPAITPNDDPKESPPSERIQQGRPTDAGIPMPPSADAAFHSDLQRASATLTGRRFLSADAAARALHEIAGPVSANYGLEVGARIYSIRSRHITSYVVGAVTTADQPSLVYLSRRLSPPTANPETAPTRTAGEWHTHPRGLHMSVPDDLDEAINDYGGEFRNSERAVYVSILSLDSLLKFDGAAFEATNQTRIRDETVRPFTCMVSGSHEGYDSCPP